MNLNYILDNDFLICAARAIRTLFVNDRELIVRRVKEEAINHRLAVYMERELNTKYSWLSVDVEYNKNYAEVKNIIGPDGNKVFIRPDILVHERGNNYNNKLAVECKLDYMDNNTKYKLMGLKNKPYNYNNSIGIIYKPESQYTYLYIASIDNIERYKIMKTDFDNFDYRFGLPVIYE
jgi:hypothetical protein